jgi:hypothetical protein
MVNCKLSIVNCQLSVVNLVLPELGKLLSNQFQIGKLLRVNHSLIQAHAV